MQSKAQEELFPHIRRDKALQESLWGLRLVPNLSCGPLCPAPP